jgi:ABC-type dipeptide/oligopeptide/nickel transport system permease component
MFFYIIRRILVAIPLMLGLVAIVFFLLRTLVPGDPAAILAGENATVELIEQVRRAQGRFGPFECHSPAGNRAYCDCAANDCGLNRYNFSLQS